MKRLHNFNCPNCGVVERYLDDSVLTCSCNKCKGVMTKSTKPNRAKGRVIGGCDNNSIKGLS